MNIIMEISIGQIFTVGVVAVALITFFVHQKFRSESIEATLKNTTTLLDRLDERVDVLEKFKVKYETLYGVEHGKTFI